jgi:hypothetical protein
MAVMGTIRGLVRKVKRQIRLHGLRKAVCAFCLKFVGRHDWFNVLQVHYAEEVDPSLLDCPPDYSAGFLPPRTLDELARDPAANISAECIRYALAKDDKCFGFVRDGALRAYSWYASTPTRVSPYLRVHFSPNYIYMYRGFTHADHRGRRLFAIGVTRALRHYLAAGYRGMVLYVDAHNLESLKACARMGFRVGGSVFVSRLFGRCFIWATPGCARFGFRIEPVSGAHDAELSAETYRSQRAVTTKPST